MKQEIFLELKLRKKVNLNGIIGNEIEIGNYIKWNNKTCMYENYYVYEKNAVTCRDIKIAIKKQ